MGRIRRSLFSVELLTTLVLVVISVACAETIEYREPEEVSLPRANPTSSALEHAHWGAAIPALEERIYHADVVVRARLLSDNNGDLQFQALEYLKGTGATQFSISTGMVSRDTQWDDREAILFLSNAEQSQGVSGQSSNASFQFTDATGFEYVHERRGAPPYESSLPYGHSVATRNPVWLPSQSVSSDQVQGTASASSTVFITLSASGFGEETATLAEIREKVDWVTGGAGIAGYSDCVRFGLAHLRRTRDALTYFGPEPEYLFEEEIASGSPRGTVLESIDQGIIGGGVDMSQYDIVWLEGPDAELFRSIILDDDNVSANGYLEVLDTARPLPAGVYRITDRIQSFLLTPCDYWPETNKMHYEVTVTAPPGTFHEALFDPATSTTGTVGFSADPAVGVLEPTRLVATTSREIEALEWADGEVTLTLSPFGALPGWQFEFLNLDAEVILTLPTHIAVKDRAARTLTWDVPSQPWTSGDQLMLRVVPIPLPETHPTLRLVLTFGFGNAGVAFRWDALSDVDGSPVTGYSIEWSLSPYGPWAVVDSSGGGIRCVANMSFEPDEATQCQLTYIAAGLTGGQPYHFRLIAHSDSGDSLPSPSLDLRTR